MTDLITAIAAVCTAADGEVHEWYRDRDTLTTSVYDETGTWHVSVRRTKPTRKEPPL